jgi:hypothetical protein
MKLLLWKLNCCRPVARYNFKMTKMKILVFTFRLAQLRNSMQSEILHFVYSLHFSSNTVEIKTGLVRLCVFFYYIASV